MAERRGDVVQQKRRPGRGGVSSHRLLRRCWHFCRRAPYAGLNRIRFQGTFSTPIGVPLAVYTKLRAPLSSRQ